MPIIGVERKTVEDVEKIAGVAPQMDDTDKQAVSIYGKGASAGDIPVLLDSYDGAIIRSMTGVYTCLASGIRDTTTYSGSIANLHYKGGIFIFDITVVPGTDTVTFSLEMQDNTSSKYITVLDGAPQAGVVTLAYCVYPGVIDGESKFDAIEGIPLPRIWRIKITHSAGTSFTYSVGAVYIG